MNSWETPLRPRLVPQTATVLWIFQSHDAWAHLMATKIWTINMFINGIPFTVLVLISQVGKVPNQRPQFHRLRWKSVTQKKLRLEMRASGKNRWAGFWSLVESFWKLIWGRSQNAGLMATSKRKYSVLLSVASGPSGSLGKTNAPIYPYEWGRILSTVTMHYQWVNSPESPLVWIHLYVSSYHWRTESLYDNSKAS